MKDMSGSTDSVAFCLWLPMFVLLLSLLIDASMVLMAQAISYKVAADVARRWVTGAIESEEEAERRASVDATFNGHTPDTSESTETADTVTITITHRLQEIDVAGVLGFMSSSTLKTSVTQWKEQ